MFIISGKYTNAVVMTNHLDSATIGQIKQFVNHPMFTNKIVIMPDAHKGTGSCIGFTMPLTYRISASIVGVDIGCGMLAYLLSDFYNYANKQQMLEFDKAIRMAIPFGCRVRNKPIMNVERQFPWHSVCHKAENFHKAIRDKENLGLKIGAPPEYNYKWFLNMCERVGIESRYAEQSIGTLGGGKRLPPGRTQC